VAAYRDFGLRAYLEGPGIAMWGRGIARARAEAIRDCVVIAAELGAGTAERSALSACAGQRAEFRTWLREGLGLALTQWGAEDSPLSERAFETALRARIEAQHGWQFENSWPSEREQLGLERALGPARAPRASEAAL